MVVRSRKVQRRETILLCALLAGRDVDRSSSLEQGTHCIALAQLSGHVQRRAATTVCDLDLGLIFEKQLEHAWRVGMRYGNMQRRVTILVWLIQFRHAML